MSGSPNTIFTLLCTFQFCADYVRKYFISKLLSFHHFDGLSMSVDGRHVRMSSGWQLWYDLGRRGRISSGKMPFELPLPRMQGQHMLPSSDASQAALDILLREGLSWHSVSNTHHFSWVFDTEPNCQTEWHAGQSALAVCFHPQASEIMIMSGCQAVKLYTSEQGPSTAGKVLPLKFTPFMGEEDCLCIAIWE